MTFYLRKKFKGALDSQIEFSINIQARYIDTIFEIALTHILLVLISVEMSGTC